MIDFPQRLAEVGAQIESVLEALLAREPIAGEFARPKRLIESMRYAMLGGGKRLRPFLAIETARAFGLESESAVRVGAAIECVHGYSLVHDDLPAMDNDDLRRGRPTTHRAFDEATAILAGDALLTLAFEVLADPATHADAETRARLCLGLARASGVGGMVGGQMLDVAAEEAAAPLSAGAIAQIQAMKTGALLRFSVEAGAVLAGAAPERRAAMLHYGEALGAAFQIADDILDAEGTDAALGKRAGKDAARNKATFVSTVGLEGARRRLDDEIATALVALDSAGLGSEGDVLRAAARFVANRRR